MMTDEEIGLEVGRSIAERRRAIGMSAKGLAEAAGVNRPNLVKIESGRGNPTILTLSHLAEALETTPGELVKGIY